MTSRKKNDRQPVKKPAIQSEPVTIKRTGTAKDGESADTADSVSKQVAALKKIPENLIVAKPAVEKAAEPDIRLQNALAENQKSNAALIAVKKENERLLLTIENLNREIEKGKTLAASNEALRLAAENQITGLQAKIAALENQIREMAAEQSPEKDIPLQPEQITAMLNDFQAGIPGSLPGLLVRDIEFRFAVALKQPADKGLTMVPVTSATSGRSTAGHLVVRVVPQR